MQQKIRQPKRVLTDTTVKTILNIGNKGETNGYKLSKFVGITSSHMYKKIIPKLVNWNCIEIGEKKGRERLIRLTPRGQEVFRRLEEIRKILSVTDNKYSF